VIADTKNQGLNQPAMPGALVDDTNPSNELDLLGIVRTIAGEGTFARALHDQLHADRRGLSQNMRRSTTPSASPLFSIDLIQLHVYRKLTSVVSVTPWNFRAINVAHIEIRSGLGAR
jgi:hypothetical protein